VGEAAGFVGIGPALQVVAMGYAHASPFLAQVARLPDSLPYHQHRQVMYIPSFPGQASEVVLATGPGLNRIKGSVWFKNGPKTRSAASCRGKPGPVHVNPRIFAGFG
jgi:hypothetical protein